MGDLNPNNRDITALKIYDVSKALMQNPVSSKRPQTNTKEVCPKLSKSVIEHQDQALSLFFPEFNLVFNQNSEIWRFGRKDNGEK